MIFSLIMLIATPSFANEELATVHGHGKMLSEDGVVKTVKCGYTLTHVHDHYPPMLDFFITDKSGKNTKIAQHHDIGFNHSHTTMGSAYEGLRALINASPLPLQVHQLYLDDNCSGEMSPPPNNRCITDINWVNWQLDPARPVKGYFQREMIICKFDVVVTDYEGPNVFTPIIRRSNYQRSMKMSSPSIFNISGFEY